MHFRRIIQRAALIAMTIVFPTGCQEQLGGEQKQRDRFEQEASLRTGWKEGGEFWIRDLTVAGKHLGGPFEVSSYEWRDEKRRLFLPISAYPGKIKGPMALVIARVRPGSTTDGHTLQSGDNIFAEHMMFDTNRPDKAEAIWALRKDLSQTMQIAGKDFDLKQGRVFLVDAVGNAITVCQIPANLGDTFDVAGPNFEQLGSELESLREKDVRVKRFWMGADPDAEES